MMFFFRIVLFCCALSIGLYAEPVFIKEKFAQARVGDYIVTKQDHTLSLLILRSFSENTIVLEEISVPDQYAKELSQNVRHWIKNHAPGHTAWIFFEIDLKEGKLHSCFSHSRQEWIHLEEGNLFLSKLLALPFEYIAEESRKKIGPPPQPGEIDTRRIWNPTLVFEGEKQEEPHFVVAEARWGKEDSILSSCLIQLYFDAKNPQFPFPYWIEIQSPHYAVKIPAINSGRNLRSPAKWPKSATLSTTWGKGSFPKEMEKK